MWRARASSERPGSLPAAVKILLLPVHEAGDDVMSGVTSNERHFALAVEAVLDVLFDDRVDDLASGKVSETELARGFHEVGFVSMSNMTFLVRNRIFVMSSVTASRRTGDQRRVNGFIYAQEAVKSEHSVFDGVDCGPFHPA